MVCLLLNITSFKLCLMSRVLHRSVYPHLPIIVYMFHHYLTPLAADSQVPRTTNEYIWGKSIIEFWQSINRLFERGNNTYPTAIQVGINVKSLNNGELYPLEFVKISHKYVNFYFINLLIVHTRCVLTLCEITLLPHTYVNSSLDRAQLRRSRNCL